MMHKAFFSTCSVTETALLCCPKTQSWESRLVEGDPPGGVDLAYHQDCE